MDGTVEGRIPRDIQGWIAGVYILLYGIDMIKMNCML
jgi:hypothetical protein